MRRQYLRYIFNKYTAFSIISAVFLCIAYYISNNLPVFSGENLDQQYVIQKVCEWFGSKKKMNYDSACFYNVSNDKQLVFAINNDGDTTGTTAITDRKKLLYLLHLIKKSETYKYVILDVMFCKEDMSEYDNDLFNIIAEMDRIVFVDKDSIEVQYPILKNKSASAYYYSTITATNFTRYEYSRQGQKTIPLKVYEDLGSNRAIKQYGSGVFSMYYSQGKLCQNSVFLTFDTSPIQNKYLIDSLKSRNLFYNLGENVLNNIDEQIESLNEEATIKNLRKRHQDKYIFIGNFNEDIHDTYAGIKCGSIILFRALQFLEEGKHIVTFSSLLLWFIVYFFISLFVCKGKAILQYVPYLKNKKLWILHYLFDIISFSTVIFIVELIEYSICWTIHSQVFALIYFAIIKGLFHYRNYEI